MYVYKGRIHHLSIYPYIFFFNLPSGEVVGRQVWTGEGTGKPLLEGKVKIRTDGIRLECPPTLPSTSAGIRTYIRPWHRCTNQPRIKSGFQI